MEDGKQRETYVVLCEDQDVSLVQYDAVATSVFKDGMHVVTDFTSNRSIVEDQIASAQRPQDIGLFMDAAMTRAPSLSWSPGSERIMLVTGCSPSLLGSYQRQIDKLTRMRIAVACVESSSGKKKATDEVSDGPLVFQKPYMIALGNDRPPTVSVGLVVLGSAGLVASDSAGLIA